MDTNRLYIASLRNVNHVAAFRITHEHKEYVLVKRMGSGLAWFKDLRTKKKYPNLFGVCFTGKGNSGIDIVTIQPFSKATGYNEEQISKRKALTLFGKKVDEWRSKK